MVSSITSMGDMMKGDSSIGAEGNMFSMMFASPIHTAVEFFAKDLLPKVLTTSMEEFNKSLGVV